VHPEARRVTIEKPVGLEPRLVIAELVGWLKRFANRLANKTFSIERCARVQLGCGVGQRLYERLS
jgi:hypothetical protein